MNESDKPSDAPEPMTDKQQLEWLWANCKIVCWPGEDSYAVEHNLEVHEDGREWIEGVMFESNRSK